MSFESIGTYINLIFQNEFQEWWKEEKIGFIYNVLTFILAHAKARILIMSGVLYAKIAFVCIK